MAWAPLPPETPVGSVRAAQVPSGTAGQESRLVDVESAVAGLLAAPAFRSIRLGYSGTQTVNQAPGFATNVLTYDVEIYNDDPVLYDLATPGQVTVTEAGLYAVNAGVFGVAGAVNPILAWLLTLDLNTAGFAGETDYAGIPTTGLYSLSTSGIIRAGANDEIGATAHFDGVAGTFGVQVSNLSYLTITKLE